MAELLQRLGVAQDDILTESQSSIRLLDLAPRCDLLHRGLVLDLSDESVESRRGKNLSADEALTCIDADLLIISREIELKPPRSIATGAVAVVYWKTSSPHLRVRPKLLARCFPACWAS